MYRSPILIGTFLILLIMSIGGIIIGGYGLAAIKDPLFKASSGAILGLSVILLISSWLMWFLRKTGFYTTLIILVIMCILTLGAGLTPAMSIIAIVIPILITLIICTWISRKESHR